MRLIKGKDTTPEIVVRRLIFGLGYRYRKHAKNVPGKPDLVFPGRHKVIFVHGCFWHRHDCHLGRLPKSKHEFWVPKLEKNRERDIRNLQALSEDGWKTMIIWECEIKSPTLAARVKEFLDE